MLGVEESNSQYLTSLDQPKYNNDPAARFVRNDRCEMHVKLTGLQKKG